MKTKFIPVEESFKQWKKAPGYIAAYNSLDQEFARINGDLSQEETTTLQITPAPAKPSWPSPPR